MGILDKQTLEMEKYISAIDFIHLITSTTNDYIDNVCSYLIINNLEEKISSYSSDKHLRIIKNSHLEHYGFDLNTRSYLDNCYSIGLSEQYIPYKHAVNFGDIFYYCIDELKSIHFINSLNLDFEALDKLNEQVEKAHQEQLNPIFRFIEADYANPNCYQLEYFRQNEFDVVSASCLLAGVAIDDVEQYQYHPRFTELYSDYISYRLMLELAVSNDELNCQNGAIPAVTLQKYLFSIGYVIKGFNDWLAIEPAKPLIDNKPSVQLEASHNELKEAKAKITDLENQLAQAKAEFADKPADSITQSNTDIHNIKKEAIKQFNRSIATVLIDLDYKGKLRKSDIANYIVPYMKELAFVLADEQQDKANNLTVTYDTLYDNHLKNLGFKQGRQSDDEKQKVNVDLLFKKQLPITE